MKTSLRETLIVLGLPLLYIIVTIVSYVCWPNDPAIYRSRNQRDRGRDFDPTEAGRNWSVVNPP